MNRLKVNDVFPDWFYHATDTNRGIFHYINSIFPLWSDRGVDIYGLDIEYHGNVAGEKPISPLVIQLIKKYDEHTEWWTDEKQKLDFIGSDLATSIVNINAMRWIRLWDTMFLEYNPIENYRMEETHTGTETTTDTPTDWKTTETQTPTDWKETQIQTPTDWKTTETQTPTDWKETQTQTPTDWKTTETQTPTDWTETAKQTPSDWTQTTTDTNTSVVDNDVFGFNSSTGVNDSTTTNTGNNTRVQTQDGTFTTETERTGTFETATETSGTLETETVRTGTFETETETSGTFETETERTGTFETETTQSGTRENKTVYDTTLIRSGNIGVTTSQQMIQSERDLWIWNYFRDIVFPDIDKTLTLKVY